MPRDFEEISAQISDVLRHEIEHLTQSGGNDKGKTFGKDAMFGGEFGTDDEMRFRQKIQKGVIKNGLKYLTLPSEIDANIQGLYLTAKKQKRPFVDVVDQYLFQFTDQFNEKGEPYLTKQDVEDVKKVWALRLPALGIKQKL
jgi:isopentenyl diphosphate isomerase/L-lactate dehydrogenase-like FMN-dependent dehydrogenase